MDHPKCKICGERHRLGSCSPTSSDGQEGGARPSHGPTPNKMSTDGESLVVCGERPQTTSGPSEAKFDRVAYQREYMVEWRARQKAKRKTE